MTNEQKSAFFAWLGNVEGFRSRLYYCPAGLPTIGFGHSLLTTKEIKKYENERITLKDAQQLLKDDFYSQCQIISSGDFVLSENELFAVGELAFNIGANKVKASGLWKLLSMYSNAIDKRNFSFADLLQKRIANKFLEFCHYHNKDGKLCTSDGLLARRKMDKELFLGTSYILK